MDYTNDEEWEHDNNNNDRDVVTNWSIGTYLRIKPPTKKHKGI